MIDDEKTEVFVVRKKASPVAPLARLLKTLFIVTLFTAFGYLVTCYFVDEANAEAGSSIKTCRYVSRCDSQNCYYVRQCCENKLDPVSGEWYRDCWVEK